MKNLKLLILSIASCGIVACQGQKTDIIREQAAGQPPAPNSQAEGGTHSGGDNGVNGRNMEDYAVNIQDDPAFKQFVLPIILKVSETHPRFASDMAHITSERTWYKIPVALNALKAADIGVSFADEDIQQFALQNLKAIWINSKLYDKFEDEQSKGRLILHEILMGIRLMKLKGSLDNCYSEGALLQFEKDKDQEYRKWRESCALKYVLSYDEKYVPGVTRGLELSHDDYDNIRALGVELWSKKGSVNKVELDAWLKTNSFRSY